MRVMNSGMFVRFVVAVFTGGGGALCLGQGTVDLPAGLADNGVKIESVKTGLQYCEGPTFDKKGNLYFSEMSSPQAKIWKVTPQGTASVLRTGNFFNGIECDSKGNLVFCEKDKITRLSESGVLDTLCKSGDYGCQLADVNDISIATTGAMFFTNHSSGKTLFYRSPTGALSKNTGFAVPNGVEWIEEKGFLYLCLTDADKVITQTVAADGSISNKKDFVSMSTPDGITLDERYNVYVASWRDGKIHVFDSTGKAIGSITMTGDAEPSGNASNCVFGGPDNKTLIITGDGGAYKVKLNVAGRIKGGASPVAYYIRPPQKDVFSGYKMDGPGGISRYYDVAGRCAGRAPGGLGPAASGMYIVKGTGARAFSRIDVKRSVPVPTDDRDARRSTLKQ